MRYVPVGNTGIWVSRICFGTLQLMMSQMRLMEGAGLLLYAFERGITTFDSARGFQTRGYLRAAFSDNTNVVIIEKSPARTYEEMEQDIAECLVDLGRDDLEIFLLYDIRSREDFSLRQGAWDYLGEAKIMGLVKAIGFSTHAVEGVELASELGDLDFLQVVFNMKGANIIDGDLTAMEQALGKAKGAGKTVCAIKPLAGGMLAYDLWREGLQFVFSHPFIDCVCIGMVTDDEVDANCAFADSEPIPNEVAIAVTQMTKRLVILDWCTGCEACITVCPKQALYMKEGFARVIHERCDWCGKCGLICPDGAIFLVANPKLKGED